MARSKYSLIVVTLLSLFFIFTTLSSISDSPISDEPGHIAAGIAYLNQDSLVYNSGSPLLSNIISTLPLSLYLTDADIPSDTSFQSSAYLHSFARALLTQNQHQIDLVLFLARLPIIIIGILLGLVIYLWAKDLTNRKTALIPLAIYSLSPTFIAHSHFATTDIPTAFFVTLTLYLYWLYQKNHQKKMLILSILSFSLAQITKVSAVFLLPMIWIFIATVKDLPFKEKVKQVFFYSFYSGLASLLVVNSLYKFRGLGLPLFSQLAQDPSFISSPFSIKSIERIIPFGESSFVQYLYKKLPLPISYHYLKVFGWVFFRSKLGQTAFLFNQYSNTGWWYYFPVTLLLKSNLIFLSSLVVSPIVIFFRKTTLQKTKPLLLASLFFISYSMFSGINTGIRLIFPAIPLLMICTGIYLSNAFKNRRYLIYLLVVIQLVINIKIFPNYLGYMNFLAGPANQHFKVLADSNLDWGQDIKKLAQYQKSNPSIKLKMNLFGVISPELYGVKYDQYGPSWIKEENNNDYSCQPLTNSTLVISANQLIGLYLEDHKCFAWLDNKTPHKIIGDSIFIYHL